MLVNKSYVEKIQTTVGNKVAMWTEKFPFLNGKFDSFGRAKLGTVNTLSIYTVKEEIFNRGFDSNFRDCFNEYLKENDYEIKDYLDNYTRYMGYPSDINPTDFVQNSFSLKDAKGKITKIKASKVLAKVQEKWVKRVPLYTEICNELKKLRAEGKNYTDYEVQRLTDDKKTLERGNLFVLYENFMNSTHGGNELWLSVNPLDKLCSSGGSGNGLNPTGFNSCWSNYFEAYSEKSIQVKANNCYANPNGAVAIGSILNNCLIYIPNGTNLAVPSSEFNFIGYKERSHAWFDVINGEAKLYVEKMYPTKDSTRKAEIMDTLKSFGFKITKDGDYDELQRFSIQDLDGIENYIDAVKGGNTLFLDRVAIDREGDLSLRYLEKDRLEYNYDSGDGFPEDEFTWYCDDCGDGHHDDDEYYWVNGRRVCSECIQNYYYCSHCEEYYSDGDGQEASNGNWYCESCLEDIAFYCEDCQEWHLNRRHDAYTVFDRYGSEITVCENCLDNYYQCSECGEYHHSRNIRHVDAQDVDMCECCYDELVKECPHCGDTFDQRHGVGHEHEMYCSESCVEEVKLEQQELENLEEVV